jgi:hypothetical protein
MPHKTVKVETDQQTLNNSREYKSGYRQNRQRRNIDAIQIDYRFHAEGLPFGKEEYGNGYRPPERPFRKPTSAWIIAGEPDSDIAIRV